MELKFQGTDLNAQLEDPGKNYWEIEIDGQPVRKMALGTGLHLYRIATGLPAGTHLVRLVRATEGLLRFHPDLRLSAQQGWRLVARSGPCTPTGSYW